MLHYIFVSEQSKHSIHSYWQGTVGKLPSHFQLHYIINNYSQKRMLPRLTLLTIISYGSRCHTLPIMCISHYNLWQLAFISIIFINESIQNLYIGNKNRSDKISSFKYFIIIMNYNLRGLLTKNSSYMYITSDRFSKLEKYISNIVVKKIPVHKNSIVSCPIVSW
jgi:hypothetical protein